MIMFFRCVFCQSWNYSTGENTFDGKYKTAYVKGQGGKFPYTEPTFVVNNFSDNNLNIYFNNAGYAGCDNKIALIKFNNDTCKYFYSISTNSGKDVWFIDDQLYSRDEKNLNLAFLLNKIKSRSKMYVRLTSDCDQLDFEFSLNGSTGAINFVAGDFLAKIKKDQEIAQKADDERRRIFSRLSSGDKFKAKANYNAPIFIGKSYSNSRYLKDLVQGEEIIFSNYNVDSTYCIIYKASTIDLSSDSMYFMPRFGVDLTSIEYVK